MGSKKNKHDNSKPPHQEAHEAEAIESQDADSAPAEPSASQDPLEVVTAERDEYLSRLQRVSADYLNYQKRIQKEMTDAREYAIADFARAMLDVLDDLERAIEHARANHAQDDPLLVGTDLVYRKALEALKRFGVEPIEAEGHPFDPSRHEALMRQPTAEAEPMTVLAVAQKGYQLKDRTLRPSKVIVAAEPEHQDNG